jgi:hypothetical protein
MASVTPVTVMCTGESLRLKPINGVVSSQIMKRQLVSGIGDFPTLLEIPHPL